MERSIFCQSVVTILSVHCERERVTRSPARRSCICSNRFFTQAQQVFKDGLAGLVGCAQADIDIVTQVITQHARLGFFDIDEGLLLVQLFEGQDHGTLVDAAFILEESAAFIQHEVTLYIINAFNGAIIVAGRRFQVLMMLGNLSEQVVATVFQL